MDDEVTILVVDDQPEILENLALILSVSGYRVLAAPDGVEALALLAAHAVDLIVADVGMPRLNGYQLYARVRENPAWRAIPFLYLTARALDSDIRYGKEMGADDYLTKPIQPEDLLAVVKGKLRRARELAGHVGSSDQSGVLVAGPLQVDVGRHQVFMAGRPIGLSVREFTILESLARSAGSVVSPQELVRQAHNLDTDAVQAGSLLRPFIRTLRRKLGYPSGEMGCIENVRGVGYRLHLL